MQKGTIIDSLLMFSRIGRTEMHYSDIDLNEMVQYIRSSMEHDVQGRQIQWHIDPLPPVKGDPVLIRQVMVNLLANAVKFTKNENPAVIRVKGESKDSKIVVSVQDNGVGFDMKYKHKLFGVFQRLHSKAEFEGTGIGLANVRRIIKRHGGEIRAEGKTGKGATFTFTIPRQ